MSTSPKKGTAWQDKQHVRCTAVKLRTTARRESHTSFSPSHVMHSFTTRNYRASPPHLYTTQHLEAEVELPSAPERSPHDCAASSFLCTSAASQRLLHSPTPHIEASQKLRHRLKQKAKARQKKGARSARRTIDLCVCVFVMFGFGGGHKARWGWFGAEKA